MWLRCTRLLKITCWRFDSSLLFLKKYKIIMTLKEKFNNVEIMFESQTGILKYDELNNAPSECEIIAETFAVDFAYWLTNSENENVKGAISIEDLLDIFKQEIKKL